MKSIIRILAAIFILVSLFGNAYALDFLADGDQWNKWSDETKASFIYGFYRGIVYITATTNNDQILAKDFPFATSRDYIPQAVNALNQFYGDNKNSPIDIPSALKFIRKELDGVPNQQIDSEKEDLKRRIRQVRERMDSK